MAAQKYWFKAHTYGYGWSPNTWQGWLTILVYFAAIVYSVMTLQPHLRSLNDILIDLFPRVLFFSAVLICITYLKGEPVRWRWGNKKNIPEDTQREN
jgi:hypothetical protein